MLEVSIHTVRDLQAAHLGPLCTKVPFKTKCEAASHRKQACRSPPLGREVLVPLSEASPSIPNDRINKCSGISGLTVV